MTLPLLLFEPALSVLFRLFLVRNQKDALKNIKFSSFGMMFDVLEG